MSIVRWLMSLGLGVVGWVAPVPALAQTNPALVWDGMVKELQVKTKDSLVDYLMAHYRYEPAPGEFVSIKTRPGKEPENPR
jgi:hypothetical protein